MVLLGQFDDHVEPFLDADRLGQRREDRASMLSDLSYRSVSSASASQVLDLACGNPFGQRLQYRVDGQASRRVVDTEPLPDPAPRNRSTPSPGCSMQPVTRPERRYPRLSGSCLVDPVTPQELRTVRLPSSRCNATPAAWWSWPVRRRANARAAAAREGQDLRSRGYYTAMSSTTTASGLSYSSSGISRSAAMTTVSASCSRAYCTRSSRLAG